MAKTKKSKALTSVTPKSEKGHIFESDTSHSDKDAMKKDGTPLNAGKIAELTGLDRKVVDKAMAQLKKEEVIVSPKRCFWQAK